MSTILEILRALVYLSLPAKLTILFVVALIGFLLYSLVSSRLERAKRASHRPPRRPVIDRTDENFFEMVTRFRDEITYDNYFKSKYRAGQPWHEAMRSVRTATNV